MKNDQSQNKINYSATMIIAIRLLKQNVIGKVEYKEIEEYFRKKYAIDQPLFVNIELTEQTANS